MRLDPSLSPGAFGRLDPASEAPLAVALSGGADSLAALIMTCAWARARGRKVIALCVDHGLNPQSPQWTARAGLAARRLGARFQALAWEGEKPVAGRPAAARAARHRLLAEAARKAGAKVLVTGHTRDDALENALMGLGPLSEWAPSPAWPEGRGLFLLRPLLGLRRSAVRAAVLAEGLDPVDDPANEDQRHPRTRARSALAGGERAAVQPPAEASRIAALAAHPASAIVLPRPTFSLPGASRALSAAVACAGGGSRPLRGTALIDRLLAGEVFTAAACGARIEAGRDEVLICREAGEFRRSGLRAGVWDGRFELQAPPGVRVRPLMGLLSQLPKSQRSRLAALPAAVRPTLPAFLSPEGSVSCPVLAPDGAASLVEARFGAACGAIRDEREACGLGRMAKEDPRAYLGELGKRGEVHEPA